MMQNPRFHKPLNLEQYSQVNHPIQVGSVKLPQQGTQMVLRMLVQAPYSRGLRIPEELEWTREAVQTAQNYQNRVIGVRHPFIYVTVRMGPAGCYTTDEWHVDGFSTRYTHLPENNYIAHLGVHPTQWLDQTFDFPEDFDPLEHNIHRYLQGYADPQAALETHSETLYMIDPYVVHRRPPESRGWQRTFLRISFTPIEIPDVNNTRNPLIDTPHYVLDGVKEFRDSLATYTHRTITTEVSNAEETDQSTAH